MKLIYYILNYLILGWFLFVISYYRDLYTAKEEYTRKEVFSYPNIIKDQFRSLFGGMPWTMGMIFFVLASLLGAWMPLWGNIFGSNYNNWFFNSAAPFLILYFIIPSIFALEINHHSFPAKTGSKNDLSEASITQEKGIGESLKTLFQDHYNLLAAGFGLGYSSYMTFNWGTYQAHPFFWNIANGAVIFWFSLQSMRNPNRFLVEPDQEYGPHNHDQTENNINLNEPKSTDKRQKGK